jgi:negative regulator of sigma E activity
VITIVFIAVLDLSDSPDLRGSDRQILPRSVNLSFFVPAFSLFALASQFMPQMFPSLTTTTSSRKKRNHDNQDTINTFLKNQQ